MALAVSHKSSGQQLNVLLLTDVFPPGSGGSGWSTYYLGKALQERGHDVRIMRPRYGQGVARPARRNVKYGGLKVQEILVPEAPHWAGRLGISKALSERTACKLMSRYAEAAVRSGTQVLHGQHAVSATAASVAARKAQSQGARVVSLATVRDYWPLCPTSTRLFTEPSGRTFECRECHHLGEYLSCVHRSRSHPLGYGLAVARWQQTLAASRTLARCDNLIAVSDYVHGELARSGRVPKKRIVTLPNLVDLPSVERALAGSWPLDDISPTEPFLLFVGKWDTNKGAHLLPQAIKRSGVSLSLVLAGDGPLRDSLEAEATKLGLDFRFHNWLDNDAVLTLMRHARLLVFPSAWQEPLSRVLLEGCAAGAAIVALNTGGTGDIIQHGVSGWLAQSMDDFIEGIRQVAWDDGLNGILRQGARRRAEDTFATPIVSAQVEALYLNLLDRMESA